MTTLLFLILLLLNLFSFFIFKKDKMNARNGKRRISEFFLCFITLIGGTIGSILSMQIYRHKTKKFSFISKILVIVLIQFIVFWRFIYHID
ncbi:DUF1294 domain-containing protein [Algoriella sp.]|uniref:DUF1294 domain-containing protein n=1 Tax=Algoriella sp. TaxID=1872434 RepID=UPI002FC9D59A